MGKTTKNLITKFLPIILFSIVVLFVEFYFQNYWMSRWLSLVVVTLAMIFKKMKLPKLYSDQLKHKAIVNHKYLMWFLNAYLIAIFLIGVLILILGYDIYSILKPSTTLLILSIYILPEIVVYEIEEYRMQSNKLSKSTPKDGAI